MKSVQLLHASHAAPPQEKSCKVAYQQELPMAHMSIAKRRALIGEAGSWLGDGPNEYRVYFDAGPILYHDRLFIGVRATSLDEARVIFDWVSGWLGAEPTDIAVTEHKPDARDPLEKRRGGRKKRTGDAQ
jgi:hypothetical protein